MPLPAPPGQPSPTPSPIPTTPGFVSSGMYLSTVYENLKSADLNEVTSDDWLSFIAEIRDVILNSEQ